MGFLLLLTWILLVAITNKNWLSARIHTKSAASHVLILAVLHGVFKLGRAPGLSVIYPSSLLQISRKGKSFFFFSVDPEKRGSEPHEVSGAGL